MPNINIDLRGKTIKILNLDDTILIGDFIRPLYEAGHLDSGFDTTFKPEGWIGTMWQEVINEIPGWINKTQREYLHFDNDKQTNKQIDKLNHMIFEIVRVIH